MTDLDLTDLLDPDLTKDQKEAELIARLDLPAVRELWDASDYRAISNAFCWLAREQDRIVTQMLSFMVDQHCANAAQ